MDVQDYKINYKSDFVLTINGDAGWAVPFCIKFWTGMPSQAYFVGFDGVKYVNCRVGDTPTQLLVMFDDHHLPIGKLKMQIAYHTTIEEFPGSVFDEVTNARDVIVTIDGTDYQVMLDFTGEDAPELEFNLPAYANEAERIQNELQRQQNEADRIAAELQREQATAAAVQGAENVNAQLSGTTLTVTNRLGVSTSVNTKGEQGEQGPVGPEGPQGEQGISIVDFRPVYASETATYYAITFSDGHEQSVAIPKGAKGDTGATGPTGPQGPQGQTGVSITGLVKTGETETDTLYNVTFSNGTTQAVAIPKGVKGDKGDTGNPGPQGAQGPKGDTVTATDYTLFNTQGGSTQGAMSQDATTKAISAQTGYYECSTASEKPAKVVTVENGNIYYLTKGGEVKVKMNYANTAMSGVTLQIGSGDAKKLLYNGKSVNSFNTWEAGETISVFYDGTEYQSVNSCVLEAMPGNIPHNSDLTFCDKNGYSIVDFYGGNVITKNFNSYKAATFGNNEDDFDFAVADENKKAIVIFKNGHVFTKNFNSSTVGSITTAIGKYVGKKISILGDSISTYGVPGATNQYGTYCYSYYPTATCRYSQNGTDSITFDVDDTYWMRLITQLGAVLGINESWRGTYISGSGSSAFNNQTRIDHLGGNGTPDLIIVFGGTNDAGNNVTIGTFNGGVYSDYDTPDKISALPVTTFADAYKAMLIRIMYTYPLSEIVCLLPTYTTSYYTIQKLDDYVEVIKEACDFFGIKWIDTRVSGINIFNKSSFLVDGIHPNAAGMKLIADNIYKHLIFN